MELSKKELNDLKQFGNGKKSVNIGDLGGVWKTLGAGDMSSEGELVKNQFGLVAPTVSSISNDFAKIELSLWQGDKEVEQSAALTSLRLVNEGWTTYGLFVGHAQYKELLGEAYWYMPEAGLGKVREIYLLNNLSIGEKTFDDWGRLEKLTYNLGNGKTQTFSGDEIIIDRTFNPYDHTKGFAKIQGVANAVDASESALEYNRKFFQNNAVPSVLLKFKKKLDKVTRKVVKASWLSQFRGKDKAHKTAIMEGDMEVERLSMNNKDMEFQALLKIADERVLANWSMNKTILGQTENINRATIEGAELNHARHVIEPMYTGFVSFLNEMYLPFFFSQDEIESKDIRFTFKSPVSQDMEMQMNVASQGVAGKPFLTINEAREVMGLPKREGEEYDEIPEEVTVVHDIVEPEVVDNDEDKSKGLSEKELALIEQNTELKMTVKNLESYEDVTKMRKESLQKEHLERALKNEPLMEKSVKKYFDGFEKRFEDNMKVVKKDAFSFDLIPEDEKQLLIEATKESYFVVAKEAWNVADREVPSRIAFDQDDLQLRVFINNSLQTFSEEVTKTSFDQLNRVFEEANVTGASIDDISKELQKIFKNYTTSRTSMIAITEVNNIANQMIEKRYKLAQEMGLIKKKEWLAVGDSHTREAHFAADGQRVEIGKSFIVDGEKLMHPGDKNGSAANIINCRCREIAVI